jgi:hypothetical protein
VSPARPSRQAQLVAALAAVLEHPRLTAYQLAAFIPADGTVTVAPVLPGGLDLGLLAMPPETASTGRAFALLQELEKRGQVRHVLSGDDIPRWLWEVI